jgi:threonyl-tRNA synthetase
MTNSANDENVQKLRELRHSAAHLLAAAVLELWPRTKLAIGPATADGFYYDFDFSAQGASPSLNSLPALEKKMRELLPDWVAFSHREVSAAEARKLFADNPYKLELINEIAERGEAITLYTAGSFTDLCRGGHVEDPAQALKHFKLLSLAGAYWRGDEQNAMLTRIYGTVLATKAELAEHLRLLEEAKKRDHRKLGKELDLFTFSPLVGSGLPLFTPRGTIVRLELEELVQSIQEPLGFQRVFIPHLAKAVLYKTSGHWDKFKEDLFHVRGKGGDEFVMKPMNCPHHTQIYAARLRSYRDLPLRFSEVTTVYRDEQAGELQGLSRVRAITQDDAHIFCRPDQVEGEISGLLAAFGQFHQVFGFDIRVRLSLRDQASPEKYLGGDETWETAEDSLRQALTKAKTKFVEMKGEAAFYGPKIDFLGRDSLRREWQMGTIQLDFTMPERFELAYTDEAGQARRPVMIHRAILGSVERFMAILLEHYAGALPLWLSPVQAKVLPITDDQIEYADIIRRQLQAARIRAEIDGRSESIGKKIREAEMQKVPVMLVVGKKEAALGKVAKRTREGGDEGVTTGEEVAVQLQRQIAARQ